MNAMDKLYPLKNSYIGSLIPHVTLFGDRAYTEVTMVKWGHMDGSLIQ